MAEKKYKKDILYKILLLGDWSVGKTCFLMRYTDNTFTDIHLSTIGIDYKLKNVTLENGETIKVQIWDTAGQDRYKSITKSYIKGAHGIILIYDVTKRRTFEGIQNWVKQIKEQVSSRVCVALVANKIDEKEKREVTEQEGIRLGKDIGYHFYEASAKESINIDECFDNLIKQININYANISGNSGAKLDNNKKNDSKGCC